MGKNKGKAVAQTTDTNHGEPEAETTPSVAEVAASLVVPPKPKGKREPETEEEREARLLAKRTNPCLCGCGELVERFFKQGHDARVHGWLLSVAKGKRKLEELPMSVRDALNNSILRMPETIKGNGTVLS